MESRGTAYEDILIPMHIIEQRLFLGNIQAA